jgi:D-alanyl-lipoteichoic acid acyltransferase DltB (MBOAT superfamily)
MGGKDAIVEWRRNDPPLASNDYTHISYEGGHKMAALLYDAMTNGPGEAITCMYDSIMTPGVDSVITTETHGPIRIIGNYNTDKPLMFTMAGFWVFLLALLSIYSLVFNKPIFRNAYLFFFSLFFYYKSGGIFFSLLLISTITDYTAGWMIYISKKKFKKTAWLVFSLFVNLGMLAYFKYTAFFTAAVNTIFGTDIPQQDWLALFSNNYFGTGFNINSIVLPVGISFFTFQTISYTIDVYRNRTEPVKNILDFGFYVSFFPQLVAGPIVRASEFIPQLYQKFLLSKREWSHALLLIVAGLVKKIVVSDYIAVNFVDNIFASPASFSGLENLLAVYGYGLQIYCDFSGYTDIAIGIALMLGFRLPLNFNSPYKARNITDFWRRWHISLSRWLKDYLYISMGGNRKSKIRTNINLLITMLLGGLWHGAAFRFIIWGALHGAGLVIHKIWMRITNRSGKGSRLTGIISIIITFNFVSFCWIFFRSEDMETAGIILERIFTGFNPGNIVLMLASYAKVLTVMIAGYIIHFLPARVKESYRGLFIKMPLLLQLLLVYLVAIGLYNIQLTDIQPFIYFRF